MWSTSKLLSAAGPLLVATCLFQLATTHPSLVTDLAKRDGEHPPTSTNPRGLWVAVTTLNHWWLLCDNVNVTYTDITGAGFTAADTTNAPCTYWSTAEGKAAIFGGAQLSIQGSLSFSTAAGSDNPGKNMNV